MKKVTLILVGLVTLICITNCFSQQSLKDYTPQYNFLQGIVFLDNEGQKVKNKEVKPLLKENPELFKAYKKVQGATFWYSILSGLGGITLGQGASNAIFNPDISKTANIITAAAGTTMILSSIPVGVVRVNRSNRFLSMYDKLAEPALTKKDL